MAATHPTFVLDDVDACDDDPEFLSAIAAAEAHSISSRKHERQAPHPSESVSSSFSHSDYECVEIGSISNKRAKPEPEGEYLAALRGTHSETWQAMNSRKRTDSRSKPTSSAYSGTGNLGFDAGGGGGANGSAGGGRSCFHCGQEGHWARDCPTKASAPPSWGADGVNAYQVPEKSCPCGAGVCKVLTANTEKNSGRQFYKCPLRKEEGQCGFFEWCDAPPPPMVTTQGFSRDSVSGAMTPEFPCPCGAGACVTLTAKTEKNMGRQFYRCPLGQGEGACGFFKWCDEATSPLGPGISPSYKSSFGDKATFPSAVTGQCYKCGMDGHWAKDCRNSNAGIQNAPSKNYSNPVGNAPSGNAQAGTCYKCGQSGHWANNCTAQQGSRAIGGGGFNRYGNDMASGRDYGYGSGTGLNSPKNNTGGASTAAGSSGGGCFKCGSQGHWSRDCPNASSGAQGKYGAGGYGGSGFSAKAANTGSCYKCGGQGHWSSECRADAKGRVGY